MRVFRLLIIREVVCLITKLYLNQIISNIEKKEINILSLIRYFEH